jgi:hypothetical protein
LIADVEAGWLGRVPGGGSLLDLALSVARPAWAMVADQPGVPGLGVSASKGDVARLASLLRAGLPAKELTAGWIPSWPHGLDGPVARALGIPCWTGTPVVAACSTGLFGLLTLADLMESGGCDRALVGAVDRALDPLVLAGFRNMGVLCGDRHPLRGGGGFAPAEGAAAVALSSRPAGWRLVAGVRLGDAGHETHFSDPGTLHAALAALWQELPNPDCIVVHGTGTVAGDAYEQAGLDAGPWSRVPRVACKSAIGHCLGASSMVELAATLSADVGCFWKVGLGFGGHLAAVAVRRV